jgi:hypothetical protein
LVEQARMMVQGEEARFVATQSRATTLLAVGGVLAGIAATVAFRFAERHYPWPSHPFGVSISIAAAIIVVLTIVASASLIYASVIALGVMRQEIKVKSHPILLNQMIANQFPTMVDDGEGQTAQTVLGLLAELHQGGQKANAAINKALWRCGAWLGVAVVTGLSLSVFALAVGAPHHHPPRPFRSPRSHPVRTRAENTNPSLDRANLFA